MKSIILCHLDLIFNYLLIGCAINNEQNFKSIPEIQNESDGLYIYEQRYEEINKRNVNKAFLSFQDYNFYPNLDSPGHDLGFSVSKSIEELKEMADQDEKCRGFNTIGFLKNEIVDKSEFIPIRPALFSEDYMLKNVMMKMKK